MANSKLLRTTLLTLLAGWLAFWLYAGRYAMLDDCFIHLRYASFLLQTHSITYDGVHRSFGTSSPLYVVVLALLRTVFSGPLLPKCVSVAFYLILIFLLVGLCLRARASVPRILLCMLTFCVVSPMGIRWLTDGMETPFHVLFVVLLALIADDEIQRATLSIGRAVWLVFFGFLMTTLRLESSSLIFLVALAILIARVMRNPATGKVMAALRASPLAVGTVLAMVTVRATFGYFLPDTAIAKSGSPSLKPIVEAAHLLLTSLNLGLGIFLLWLLSATLLLRARPLKIPLAVIATANAIFPLILVLACVRGQMVQGIRYLLWCLVFSTLWNTLQLARLLPEPARKSYALLAAVGVVLIVLVPFEWHWVRPVLAGRGATYREMRDTQLALLRNDTIMSADVGYIGYFSGAAICDVEGLVDGRSFASKTKRQRIQACATAPPTALFLNDFQLTEASEFMDFSQWSVCRTIDFAGVTIADRHYLMVPSDGASVKCAALGGHAVPYQMLVRTHLSDDETVAKMGHPGLTK